MTSDQAASAPATQESTLLPPNPNPVGRPRRFGTADELYALCQEYFNKWLELRRPLTVVGLCCYIDVRKSTFCDYAAGKYDTPGNEFSEAINKAREFIENDKVEKMLNGEYKTAGAIFDLKNNHGYADKVEQVIRNAPGEKFKTDTILTAQDGIDAFQRLNAPGS